MDVGAAFEMVYMSGLNKSVLAYYDAKPFYSANQKPGLYADRIAKFYSISKDKLGFNIHG